MVQAKVASSVCSRVSSPGRTVGLQQTCKQTDVSWTAESVCTAVPGMEAQKSVETSDQMNEQLLKYRDAVKTVSVTDALVLKRRLSKKEPGGRKGCQGACRGLEAGENAGGGDREPRTEGAWRRGMADQKERS